MKKKKVKESKFSKQQFIPIIFLIILVLIIILPNYEKNCGDNQECFNEAAQKCAKAKVYIEEENTLFEYRIKERKENNCYVTITVITVDPEAKQETIDLFEGKSMDCYIPFEITEMTNTNDIISYCSGDLKEAIYELIIKKMYGVIAQNLGSIISEVKGKI